MKKEELNELKIKVSGLSNEELNKISGGGFLHCYPGCIYRDNHCECPEQDDVD